MLDDDDDDDDDGGIDRRGVRSVVVSCRILIHNLIILKSLTDEQEQETFHEILLVP